MDANMHTNNENKQDVERERGDDQFNAERDENEFSSDTEEEDVEGAPRPRRKRGKSGWNIYLGTNTLKR